jgi:hypothetical protein
MNSEFKNNLNSSQGNNSIHIDRVSEKKKLNEVA